MHNRCFQGFMQACTGLRCKEKVLARTISSAALTVFANNIWQKPVKLQNQTSHQSFRRESIVDALSVAVHEDTCEISVSAESVLGKKLLKGTFRV